MEHSTVAQTIRTLVAPRQVEWVRYNFELNAENDAAQPHSVHDLCGLSVSPEDTGCAADIENHIGPYGRTDGVMLYMAQDWRDRVWHFVRSTSWYLGILDLNEYRANAWPVPVPPTPKMPCLLSNPHFGSSLFGFFYFVITDPRLIEEADDLAGNVLPPGLLVVHDTGGSGQDDVAELTRGQQLDNPLLEIGETDVVAGRDDTGLVQAAVELDNDLAGSVVVDLLEFTNIAWRRNSVSGYVAKD